MAADKRAPMLVVVLLVVGLCGSVLAQANKPERRFTEGDEVEYLWGSKWYPGIVLAVEGNAVAIEYDWGGSPRREQVEAFKLRFAWEARALTPMRFWSDASKQFKVRAAAVNVKDGMVVLHKDDGEEISVPIDKLSDTDQRMLQRLRQQAGPPVAELPALSQFSQRAASGWGVEWKDAHDLANVSPDPPPAFANVPMKGVGFPRADFHESLIHVHPIGGADGWMVAGTVVNLGGNPSRILWAALTRGKVHRVQLLPAGERLAAVDPASRQIVTVNPEGPRLTLWNSDPTMEVAQAKKSWLSKSDSMGGAWNNWCAIVAPNRVLHEWGRQKFIVWDVENETEAYRIDQESFFSAKPTLSPGKRYIALPEDKRVRILEAATGETLARLPIEGGSAAGVGFSPDGKLLAVLTRSQLAVWECGASGLPKTYTADTIGTPFSATVEWVDEHMLLIDRETLYDTRLEMPIWNYQTKTFEVQDDRWGEHTTSVLGGKLCYAVNLRGQQSGFIIGAVELPGPGVRERTGNFDPESLYVIGPGHRVNLEIKCGQYDQQVREALMRQIADNGWEYDPSASTVLKAEMGRRPTQTITYKSMHGAGTSQSVTVTPYFSSLVLEYNGQIAWQTGGGSGAPAVMFLEEGKSAQSEVDAMQKPDPELFHRAEIPPRLTDPAKRKGLGSSLISAQGLTPID